MAGIIGKAAVPDSVVSQVCVCVHLFVRVCVVCVDVCLCVCVCVSAGVFDCGCFLKVSKACI